MILLWTDLEHTDEGLREAVKGASRFGPVGEVKLAPEHLHAEQGENDDEEEEEEQEASDGAHRVEEGGHQVTEGRPVPYTHKHTRQGLGITLYLNISLPYLPEIIST